MTSDAKMESLKVKQNKLSYFRQVQRELKKVSWTSKDELFLNTKVVLISTFLFSIGIYVTDVIIHMVFAGINNFARLIFG